MDINRYYVPPSPSKESSAVKVAKHNAATSRFVASVINPRPVRLPTPQAFFERQQLFKDNDKKAMLRFAQKSTAKHNLKLRRKELKSQQRNAINELTNKINNRINEKKGVVEVGVEGAAGEKKEKVKKEKVKKEVDDDEEDGEKVVDLPELREALEDEDDEEVNFNVLKNFFQVKAPERIADVEHLLKEHKGREYELFDKVAREYNVVRSVKKGESPTRSLRASLADVKSTLKRTGSQHSFRNFGAGAPIMRHHSSFVEEEAVPMKPSVENGSGTPKKLENPGALSPKMVPRTSRIGEKMLKRPSSFVTAKGSVMTMSVASMFTVDSDNDEIKEFQKALDAEIKAKLNTGEYVTSIIERGGRWWVNREKPKVHPSQRRRNTLLDDLRNGNIPLSI